MKRLNLVETAGVSCLNPAEISVFVDLAAALGIPSARTLKQTGLIRETLEQGRCLTTVKQHATVVANAARASGDRLMPLRAGLRVHLSAFGIVGYALRSSSTLQEALALSS